MIEIGKHKIDINCPQCDYTIQITLGQVAKGETIICGFCNSSIKLVDNNNNSAKQGIRDIDKAFSSLHNTLKSLGKKR